MRLILSTDRTTESFSPQTDVRKWTPGTNTTFTIRFTAPRTPGTNTTFTIRFTAPRTPGAYRLSLALPDPTARLASNPAYAVQLANNNVWQPATGRNALGVTLAVLR